MRTLAAAAMLVLLGAGAASAQPYYGPPPPPPEPSRGNIILGGGIGLGTFAVQVGDEEPEDYDDAFAYELRFGGMITPRVGLGIELFGWSQDDTEDGGEEFDVFQRNIGAFVRWWALPRLWLQGGIASARVGANSDSFGDVSYKGVGVSFGIGFEILHAPKYALDIGLRVAGAGYDTEDELGEDLKTNSAALGLAFNWFF